VAPALKDHSVGLDGIPAGMSSIRPMAGWVATGEGSLNIATEALLVHLLSYSKELSGLSPYLYNGLIL
jgi:hypothetical protein